MTTEGLNLMDDSRPPPMPGDFGERLEGLKKLSGLRWQEFAQRLGVSDRGVLQWRRGRCQPSRTSYLAIMALAKDLPGGYELMTGEGGTDDAEPGDGGPEGHD